MRLIHSIAAGAAVLATIIAGIAHAAESCVKTSKGDVVCGKEAGAAKKPAASADRPAATAFVRGGYIFMAGGNQTPDGSGTPIFGAGYRAYWNHDFGYEAEIIYNRDSEVAFIGVGNADVAAMGVAALASARWQAPQLGPVTPFISAGIGPSYNRTSFDDGVTQLSSGSVGLGYSGRAGVEAQLIGRFSVEAAYRYLNATSDAAVAQHSGEVGLNYNF